MHVSACEGLPPLAIRAVALHYKYQGAGQTRRNFRRHMQVAWNMLVTNANVSYKHAGYNSKPEYVNHTQYNSVTNVVFP